MSNNSKADDGQYLFMNDLNMHHHLDSNALNRSKNFSFSIMNDSSSSDELYSRKVFVGGLPPDIDESK